MITTGITHTHDDACDHVRSRLYLRERIWSGLDSATRTTTLVAILTVTLYHVLAIRLETFSKEPMKIFMVSNRAESKEHNGIKVMTIPLVESMEMIIEVEGILG
jgi:hypothetical protein